MDIGKRGFTIIEVVMVMVIGIALTSMAVTAFAPAQRKLAVRSARETLVAMHARTRAHAIEAGTNVVLNVDFAQNKAWISRDGTTLETLDFYDAMHVDLQGGSSTLQMCMNARGFGEASCNSFSSGTDIFFVQNTESKQLQVFPLGLVVLP